ncbi:unnamed protein product [Phytophthora fragariaefolia]|uniref:Unnamed protein product n=1 Tax=Phytophthora fragariaefolia TaxID=1490495 RepID=A0A9W6XS68_9STRA|nr:unnamed protein product [Phytophthora fragariaefolia]
MWMQQSAGGGHFHDRNRLGPAYGQGAASYGGGGGSHDAGDWKSKILESGQWLGGKVIEYGGKLARGPSSEAIPEHYAQQMPRNDGRANWMADIRSSSSSYAGGAAPGGGYGGGYQNDFATERPRAYSDYGRAPAGGYEPKSLSSAGSRHQHGKSRHAKKKSDAKKKKSSKKSRKKQQSESDSDSDSDSSERSEAEELSVSESSDTESADERRHKSKAKAKKKTNAKKNAGFYSDESESDQEDRKKAAANYAFSFDPAKLPPPPAEKEKSTSKKTKSKKNKKDKSGKKSRTRRQSVASTDDESASDKESARKAKKCGSKKAAAAAAATSASVDLLGVDLDVPPVAQTASASLPAQEVQPSIFDAPQNQNPLQDLAGLSFAPTPVQSAAPAQQSVYNASSPDSVSGATPQQQQADAFRTNLLPENNIVDFDSLASEKKKALSANPEEKRTLNDMQKARGADQPTPVMAMPTQGQQQMQPNMSGGMMQLGMTMNQLQITDGATGMQQQMYPNMQMQHVPMQGMTQPQMQPQMMMMQPQMGMMAPPQMMNMQMMQQQQHFTQGGASVAPPTGAQPTAQGMIRSSNSSDPFHQLP